VVITGRDTERGAQTVAAIEADGGHAEFIAADLNDIKSVRRLAEQAGDVDVLVNNAASLTAAATLEQDVESFDIMFDVDVRAPFFLTAALLPKMIGPGIGCHRQHLLHGRVGRRPLRAGHRGRQGGTGIFHPVLGGGVRRQRDSRQHRRARAHPHRRCRRHVADGLEQLGSATPLGRTADPSEIAEAIVFLASPQASYLTGATVLVDGGFTAI